MKQTTTPAPNPPHRRFRTRDIFLALIFLEGLAALIVLASIPGDPGGGLVFGFSVSRLALLAIHLAFLAGLACFLFFGRRAPAVLLKKLEVFSFSLGDRWIGFFAAIGMTFSWLVLQILLSIYQTTGSFREFAYYQRLLPLLGWFFLIGLQILLFLGYKHRSSIIGLARRNRQAILPTLTVFIIFLAVWLFASLTGIGLTPDKYGWGAPGVPLMEWQIWLSLITAVLLAALLGTTASYQTRLNRKDVLICLGVWLAAVVIWGSQPVPPGFFATPGRLPNFEIYPFSDGAFYDFYAQNIVIGNGYRGEQIPPRPLYILFLAVAHFIAGQDYTRVVFVQTLLLAAIPVLLYLLGRVMHSQAAGLAAASMAILRELTTIFSTPFTDDVSNSKLLFADLPSTLGIALVLLLVFLWLKNIGKRSALQMASGLAMGILLLVRTQSLLLVPVIILTALIVYRKHLRQFALDLSLFALVFAVTVAPWLIRNHAIAGQFIFDHPESQSRVMAQRYDFNGDFESLERRPGEGTGEYSERLSDAIKQTVIEHPLYVAEFVTAHFLNNEISDLLILPLRSGLESPRELVFPTLPFWQDWDGQISFKQGLLLGANLLVVCLGIGISWKKHHILGLLPLLVNLTYNLSTAVARYSGWRYLLPVDWIAYFYFSIGMVAMIFIIFNKLSTALEPGITAKKFQEMKRTPACLMLPKLRPASICFFLALVFGMSLILAEKIIPPRYTPEENARVLPSIRLDPVVKSSGLDLAKLSALEGNPDAFIVRGRALYPRFYAAGEGESKTAKTGYEPSPDARLVFLVASQPDGLTIFRTPESPDYFPNGSDVMVVGCQHPLYAEAWIIKIEGSEEKTYISPDAFGRECKE